MCYPLTHLCYICRKPTRAEVSCRGLCFVQQIQEPYVVDEYCTAHAMYAHMPNDDPMDVPATYPDPMHGSQPDECPAYYGEPMTCQELMYADVNNDNQLYVNEANDNQLYVNEANENLPYVEPTGQDNEAYAQDISIYEAPKNNNNNNNAADYGDEMMSEAMELDNTMSGSGEATNIHWTSDLEAVIETEMEAIVQDLMEKDPNNDYNGDAYMGAYRDANEDAEAEAFANANNGDVYRDANADEIYDETMSLLHGEEFSLSEYQYPGECPGEVHDGYECFNTSG